MVSDVRFLFRRIMTEESAGGGEKHLPAVQTALNRTVPDAGGRDAEVIGP